MVAPAALGAARPRAAPERPAGRKVVGGGSRRPGRGHTGVPCPKAAPAGARRSAPFVRDPPHLPRALGPPPALVPAPLRLGAAPAGGSPEQRKFPVPAPQPALGRIQSLTSCWQFVPFPVQRLSEHRAHHALLGRCRCRGCRLPSGHRGVSPRCVTARCPARRGSRPACCSLAGATDDSRGSGTHRWLWRWKVVPRIN